LARQFLRFRDVIEGTFLKDLEKAPRDSRCSPASRQIRCQGTKNISAHTS
jgi:hypothetical protein